MWKVKLKGRPQFTELLNIPSADVKELVYAFNLSILEAEAEAVSSLEFKASSGYVLRTCLEKEDDGDLLFVLERWLSS